MSSYNQWLSARGEEYKVALADAKTAWDSDPTTPAKSVAYAALNTLATGGTDGWSNTILTNLRTGSTDETEILLMQNWLANDYTSNSGTHAAALGLSVQTAVDTGARTALGGLGVEGGQYRRWKGQPLYTFGEGLLVGKSNQVIAVFGDHPAEIASAGFGTDGLIFFDGKPMSKNTNTPGVVVVGGDLMVSGSIRGDGGVVIIDDVIQLETGVANPAGIALDSSGNIKLRHRGQGFTQFIDPALTQAAAEDAAKVWVSSQNTDATRLADSMIPNSNFDLKEYFQVSSTYYSRPAGVAVVGTADKHSVSYPTGQSGILKMNPSADSSYGFLLPAVDVSEGGYEGKFNIKIRFSSDAASPISQGANSGIFIVVCETDATPTQFADNKYVYDTTNSTNMTGSQEDRSDYYETNVTFTSLTSPSLSVPSDGNWSYQSYDFTKQSSTTYVSLLVYVENMGAASLFVDYVSMKPSPPVKSAIEGLVTAATSNITTEAGSILQGASLTNLQSSYDNVPQSFIKTKPTAAGTYATFAEASGDNHSDYGGDDDDDKGVSITTTTVANLGMVSQAFDRDALLYTVGARIRALASSTTVKIYAVETNFDTSGTLMDPNVVSWNLPTGYVTDSTGTTATGTRQDIKLAELQGDGTYNAQDSDPVSVTKSPSDGWITVLGTYKPTRTSNGQDSPVRKISIGIEVTSMNGSVAIDFLYCARQTSTSDIASTLADEAYSDSQAYVSLLNSFVAKEQGSLIPNAQMGVQEFIKGSGSSVANHIRPSGFRYIGWDTTANSGNGDGYLLSYAPEGEALGKDAVMKVELGGTTDYSKGVTTPPFPVGTDRYAVIIRGRRVSEDGSIKAGINYTTATLETGKTTIAATTINFGGGNLTPTYETDVQTGSVNFQELTLNDNTLDSSMTNYTATWDLVGSNLASPNVADYDLVQLASLTIVATKDFYIDYLYIVPQTISGNIAELNDNVVRNFFNNLNELAEQENDSLIGNGNFTIPKASNTNIPSSWFPTANTDFQFIQHTDSTNTTTYINPSGTNLAGNGTMVGLKYSGTTNATTGPNIYSGVLNLPNATATTWTDSDGSSVSPPTNAGQKYTVFAKVRTHSATGNDARVYLRYHEYDSPITNQTHIYDTTKASQDSSNGVVSTRSNDINCTNITDASDNGQDYEDVNSTAWKVIGGTYTATSTAKHVSFSIQVTFPNNALPTANSGSGEPTTFFYVDYFYVGIQTMTQDIAVALAQAETDIKLVSVLSDITDLENTVEAEDPSLSLITNSTFANLYDTGDPDLAKYWVATRSTKDAVEVYPNGTGGISSIGTYATPYNATGEADNNYGMLSKLVVEPALAVTTHSFDALGLTTSSLGKYNIIVRCRGKDPTITDLGYSSPADATSVTGYAGVWSSTGSYDYNYASFTDSTTNITLRGRNGLGENRWIADNDPTSEQIKGTFPDMTSTNTDDVYIYFGLDFSGNVEADDDFFVQLYDVENSAVSLDTITVDYIASSDDSATLAGSSWTTKTTASSTSYASLSNVGDLWNGGVVLRVRCEGDNAKNIRHLRFDGYNASVSTGDSFYLSMFQISYHQGTTTTTHPYSVQIIAHEKYTALAANATHLIETGTGTQTPDSNLGLTIDTFANDNSAGKSTTLNAIDLGNNSATASTTQNVTTDTATWRNVLASYTPDTRAHAVSFEFRFDSDQNTDGSDSIVYVDSVHMEISTADQDLVVALANERAETAEGLAIDAAAAAGSEAQQKAAIILAAGQSEAAQTRDNIFNAVSSEQGSIMYNSAFAYSTVYSASDGGVTESASGSMTATIVSTNAIKEGEYRILIATTGSQTTSGSNTFITPATYRLQKKIDGSWSTITNPSTGAIIYFVASTVTVPLHDTGISVSWDQAYGGEVDDQWSWTTTVQERPIGYRLGRVPYSNLAIRNNLHYNTLPSSTSVGGAKIQIQENRSGGINTGQSTYSLLCPPVQTPADGQKTSYEVAVKLKSSSGDTSQTLAIRIHELYEYFDQDTYVTFCANIDNAKNLTSPAGALDDAGATIPTSTAFNVTTSKGIDDGSQTGTGGTRLADTDVYMFAPSSRDLPKRTVMNGWSGYSSAHADWPIGCTQDVTIVKLSEFDTSSGSTENYGESFVTIGGGFDTKEDTKMFVVELIFTNVDDEDSTIIDYIHVGPSTIGEGAAGAIATTNAIAQVSTLLGDGICSLQVGGPYTTQETCESAGGVWTAVTAGSSTLLQYLNGGDYVADDAVAADITAAKEDVTQQVANMKLPSLQPNGTFSNWLNRGSVPGWSGGSASTKFPVGYSLHRKANANAPSTVNAATDERINIQYNGTYNVDDPKIKIANDSDQHQSLVCPYILASSWGSAEALSFAITMSSSSDTNIDMYVRCHQMFSSPVGVNGTDGTNGTGVQCDAVLQNGTETFTANNITYDQIDDHTETSSTARSPAATYFKAIDPRATKAMAETAGASGQLGVVEELNLINLLDESVVSAANFIDDCISSAGTYQTFGGSCPLHTDAVAVSFEIYFYGVGGGNVLIDEISVLGMDTWVDIAHMKAADRVLDIVEDIEEEEAATLTNVILNPKGAWTYKPNMRYEVPRSWRYLGEQPFGLGYRSTATGALLDKPLPRGRKIMSMGEIGERGIAKRGSSDYINQGMVSKPWKVDDDLYTWELEVQIESSGYEGVRVFVLEYDTDSKPQWLKPRYAYSYNSSNDATTMYGGGTATATTRQVCLHHKAADDASSANWSYTTSTWNNGVEYDAGQTTLSTYNITKTNMSNNSTSTISSDTKWLHWNISGRYKTTGTYIPTDGTKYAALWICTWSATSKLCIYNVEMNSDKTSAAAVGIRKGKMGLDLVENLGAKAMVRATAPAHTQTGHLDSMTFTWSSAFSSFFDADPTTPEAPTMELQEGAIAAGHSLTMSDGSWPFTDGGTTHYDNMFIEEPNSTYRGRNKLRGLCYAGAARYYYTDSDADVYKGVSYYKSRVSDSVGLTSDGETLWFKPDSDDGGGIRFFCYDSYNDWHVFFKTSQTNFRLMFAYDTTEYGFVDNDSNGTANDGDTQMNFTGQHHCITDNIVVDDHTGLIVVTTGSYKNMGDYKSRNKPTINEALPIVELSSKRNQKTAFGIVSNAFDDDGIALWKNGNWGSHIHLSEEDKGRVAINSLGEGAIWVCDINGNLENGDYITTCEVPGYGMLQDDDLLHNYTVAKITQDCNFELDNPYYDCVEFEFEGETYRKAFVGCTYHCG